MAGSRDDLTTTKMPAATTSAAPTMIRTRQPEPPTSTCDPSPASAVFCPDPAADPAADPTAADPAAEDPAVVDPAAVPMSPEGDSTARPDAAATAAGETLASASSAIAVPSAHVTSPVSLRGSPRVASTAARLASAATASAAI